jgi:tRNA(Ile)-lysidine synthase
MDFCQRLFPGRIGELLHLRVARIIAREGLLNPQDSVVIAVSGGPDSTALLLLLSDKTLDLNCIAAYIDHGLRPHETGAEIETVRRLAVSLGAEFFCRTIPVKDYAKEKGCSIEEAARILRYQALEKIRDENGAVAIAVAHTADDQVEEFLLRMTRGCGREGLAGMHYRHGRIIRPLLNESKETLVNFLSEKEIHFCLDSSNQDRRFLRNRIRLDLLPALEKDYNPGMRRTILQIMDIMREEESLLDHLTEEALAPLRQTACQTNTEKRQLQIPLSLLSGQHPAIRRRMLEEISWEMGARPGFRQIELLVSLLENGKADGEVHLVGGLRVKKSADGLVFSYPRGRTAFRGSGRKIMAIDEVIEAPGIYEFAAIGRVLSLRLETAPETLVQEGRLFVDAGKIVFPLRLQSIARGQRFTPFGGIGSKKINRFLNDRGIKSEMRPFYPVLTMQEQVIALPGLAIDDSFRADTATQTVLAISWHESPVMADQETGSL